MKPYLWVAAAAILGVGYLGYANRPASPGPADIPQGVALAEVRVPDVLGETARIGQRVFEAKCVDCHGLNAQGRQGMAPPLVHKIYEPSHHADESFQRAVALGVASHHWRFGDMPAVDGLTRGDVAMIIDYIRELQRANDIF